MFLDPAMYSKRIHDIIRDLESDPDFKKKCEFFFTECVKIIKAELNSMLGWSLMYDWEYQILTSETKKEFPSIVSFSVVIYCCDDSAFKNAENDTCFNELVRSNIKRILSPECKKEFEKILIGDFVSMEQRLPNYLNEIILNLLYVNFGIS